LLQWSDGSWIPAQLLRVGGAFRFGDDGMPAAAGGWHAVGTLCEPVALAMQGGNGLPSPPCARRDRKLAD